jgi:hypothetical protein
MRTRFTTDRTVIPTIAFNSKDNSVGIRRFAKLMLVVSLSMLACHHAYGEEYVYVRNQLGAIPPEPFADDFDLESSDVDSALDITEDEDVRTTHCPPIEKLLGEIAPANSMSASITNSANRPSDCSEGLFLPPQPGIARATSVTPFNWQATNFFHRPLYFDDTPLERYGQTKHPLLQPVISGGRFFGTFLVLPYKMGIDRTGDCVSTLGYYRPGSCTPCIRERLVPALEGDAALLEAGAALALIFILP